MSDTTGGDPSPSDDQEIVRGLRLGPMRWDEAVLLSDWAAAEGWNPGLADVEVAWAVDPAAFIAVRRGEELVAGGTIFSHSARFGFMGLFIVRNDHRGAGLGRRLWHYRRDRLIGRLASRSAIGMDGVLDMVPFYARGGFRLAYRDVRFEGIASGDRRSDVVDLSAFGFAAVADLDQRFFPVPRPDFLRRWVSQPGSHTAGIIEDGRLVGFGMLRPCRVGYKFGPVLAERDDLGGRMIEHLMGCVAGDQVQLDVPEPNGAALRLAASLGLRESFACARMYLGEVPDLPIGGVFGVTSFEFG